MQGRLTVFYDGQFWVGVFEREEHGQLQALRMVFGPEPREEELYSWILTEYYRLQFGKPLSVEEKPRDRVNPKRRQREAHQEMLSQGVGTKAQAAVRLAYEAAKETRHTQRTQDRRAEEQRKFELKQEKRKEKHRGH